jgi:hypothetical protein
MDQDWQKLLMDCSWKRLQGFAFRNVPCPPQTLVLTVTSVSGQFLSTYSEQMTCNPTWPVQSISLKSFPITLHLHTALGELLWTGQVDLRLLYFVTSDLKDIDGLKGIALLLHFQNEGYYTVSSQAADVCEAAKNNSQQIKIAVTTLAQAREVDFYKLQTEYMK